MSDLTLIGMPGSGKSTIGVVLAKTLGRDFVDTDLILQRREGALLQELLDRRGTEAFLDLEAAAICSVAPGGAVIAPGGSCVLREAAMAHLKALGPIVYLRLSYPALAGRIQNLKSRGIAFAPGQTLRDVYDQRIPLYERWADYTVDADALTIPQTLEAVRRVLP